MMGLRVTAVLISLACAPAAGSSSRLPDSADSGPPFGASSVSPAQISVSSVPTAFPTQRAEPKQPRPAKLPTATRTSADSTRKRPTVRTLLTDPSSVGRTVRITGLCLGYGNRAEGPPPFSRSDWQLAQDEVAIYVVGRIPTQCAPNGPPSTVTITALVRQDTLRANTMRPRRPRQYLELIPLPR